jgi:PKD repeat protein
MESLKSRGCWKKALKMWIKESEATDDMKLKIIQQMKKYRGVLTDYERAKLLIGKAKSKIIPNFEKQELSERIKRLSTYSEIEIDEIMELYKQLGSVRNTKINPNQEIEKATIKPKFYQRASIPVRFVTSGRDIPTQPQILCKKHYSLLKRVTPRKLLALGLIALLLSAWSITIFLQLSFSNVDVNFKSNTHRADVNEPIIFNWNVEGSFSKGVIIFGDGVSVELNHTSKTITHSYNSQGIFTPIIHVWNQQGYSALKTLNVEIVNDPPQFEVKMLNFAQEDELIEIRIANIVDSEVDLKEGILNYVFDFADNNQTTSREPSVIHKWENAGIYPISVTLFDDQSALSQKTQYIEILNKAPEAHFDHNVTEDRVEFIAEGSVDTESDITSLTYIWNFGDNHTSFGKYVSHAYDTPGEYTVELFVKDDNGAVDQISKPINIGNILTSRTENNKIEPVIELDVLGPFTLPQNIEGQIVDLDVEVYDSLENQLNLAYSWYDETNDLISNDKRPSVLLNDGEYRFTLNVTNQHGQVDSEKIAVKVNNIAPEVFVSNYVYNGPNNGGELELVAYGYDSIFDINRLKFYWEITNGYTNYTFSDPLGKATSTMKFTCEETAIYRGQVIVVDPSGKECVATFFVNVVIDSNKNNVPDNIEQMLEYTGESLETFSDYDNDFISDECEQLIFHTNFVNPDTDNDGLCDGLDASGIGELSLGTSPLNEDTDFDLLKDSIEFYGWNISINTFEGTKELHVSSEPLNYDTDGDYLSDYDEYLIGSNPRLKDSDGDLLDDLIDPYPTNYDQDSDYLSDKIELDIGSDLNSSDSDLDGIDDGEEFYGWGLLGFKTNPLSADSDKDFAPDGSEMKFYAVQLENLFNNEIRVNVSNPVSLHFPYMFQKAATAQISVALSFGEHGANQTGEYGVNDSEVKNLTITIRHEGYNIVLFETTTNRTRHFSHVIDISEVMNNHSLSYNYHGNYVLEVDDPTAGCLVEQFEIEFSRYLDPHNDDFDGDGILDGVEMNLLVEGTQYIDVKDTYKSTQRIIISTDYNSNATSTYQLDIPQIGRVFNAQLFLEFESIGPIHTGTIIEVELAKKYLDNRKTDFILMHLTQQYRYDTNEVITKTFNLTQLQQANSIFDLYGEYSLTVSLEAPQEIQDQMALTEFYIQTETYVEAGPLDTHAWITDPALNDTDADGWSDSYEIFTTGTNPLNDDTDRDGAIDPNDREPLKNIILQISPIFASYKNQAWPTTNPILKIGMYLQVNDLLDPNGLDENNKIGFFTSNKQTTTDIYGWDWYFTLQTALWNTGEGTHYYVDISDDFTAQSNEVRFYFTLWESIPFGDLNRFDGNWYMDTFDLESTEDTQPLLAQHTGIFGRTDEISVSVTKIVVEKANPVAIYSKNETSFNGHYQHQERMNVFQLHITDSGDGTPFVQGVNAIVVPTNLFTKTKLNAFIENGQLDQTVLYSDNAGEFEFYSVDRDGNIVDEECGDADFVFVRFEITSQEAMELLELLLICAVNQSLDDSNQTITDLGAVYSYVSTKLNGTNAVLLNIPNTISRFVLWGGGYEDSPYGSEPETFSPIFIWLFLIPFVLPLAGLFMLFNYSHFRITEFNTKNADVVGLTILSFLANLLWTLIRAALIIVAYILLALEVLTISIIFLGIGVVLDITSLFSGFECEWGINWAIPYGVDTKIAFIDLQMSDYDITVEAHIIWTYWEYFDIYFPFLTMDSKLGSILENIINPDEDIATRPELNCGFDHVGELKYDFHATYRQRPQGYDPAFVKLMLISPTGIEFNYTMEPTPGQTFNSYYDWVRFNTTIDFSEDFDYNERQGQWSYCFITQATVINTRARWPYEGYAIGPCFHVDRSFFYCSTLDPYSGYIDDDFTFKVYGYDDIDNFVPSKVTLKIKWPNQSIQGFLMNMYDSYTYNDTTYFEYSSILNFSHYLVINSPTTLEYYYEAIFHDGSTSVLWDYENIDENTYTGDDPEEIPDDYEYIECWFEGPLLKPRLIGNSEPPIIWKWYVEDLTWNRLLHDETEFKVLSPISDEFILRFYVYIEDPDGDHIEHWDNGFEFIPMLILTNLENPNASLNPIPMKWTGGHYGQGPEGYDEYFVDLHGDGHYAYKYDQTSDLIDCNFTSGAWSFAFSVTDNQSHITVEKPVKKLWHVGSFDNMINTFFYGYPTGIGIEGFWGSIALSFAYIIMAILAASGDTRIQTIAQILAAGIAVVDMTLNFLSFFNFAFTTDDTGSLLGLGFHSLIKSIGFLIALKYSKNEVGSFSFKFLNKMSVSLMAISILNMFTDFTQSMQLGTDENGDITIENEEDADNWDGSLGEYPMKLVTFLSSVIGLTSTLVITSGMVKTGSGPENIKKIILIHTLISIALSSFCFVMYFIKSGFIHIASELLFNI